MLGIVTAGCRIYDLEVLGSTPVRVTIKWLLPVCPPNVESKSGATSPQFWALVPRKFLTQFFPPFWASSPLRKKILLKLLINNEEK